MRLLELFVQEFSNRTELLRGPAHGNHSSVNYGSARDARLANKELISRLQFYSFRLTLSLRTAQLM